MRSREERTSSSPGYLEETISTNALLQANAYSSQCPTGYVLDHIADKWAALIMGLLVQQPLRFNALLRQIDGLSQKVLSQTLKRLERDGLVHRKAFATVPVTVEYSVTPLGATLAESLTVVINWAQDNLQVVLEAQQRYDTDRKAA